MQGMKVIKIVSLAMQLEKGNAEFQHPVSLLYIEVSV